ncbi:class I SAM-dependent methyltransferase [Candidatus Saccharibacteria bacterium]|nr:class I SAM-dependent methyltransferase [Candidatus Saccharibacteria bacterium]
MKAIMEQVSQKETQILLELLEKSLATPGDVVELGCYKGDTSILFQKLLQEKAPAKKLWLYDSFAGLPQKTKEDNSAAGDQFKEGELFVTKKEVITKFKKHNLKLPIIKKNFFENLNPALDLPEKIAFAFLDGDLYTSIKTSLKLVAPKIQKNGVIVVHDYNNPELPGVSHAVDEFISQAPSSRLSLSSSPSSSLPLLPQPNLQRRESLAILHC